MSDKLKIDSLIQKFFNIFTNKGKQSPDWSMIYETCIPEILIVKKVGSTQEIYNLESFIQPRKQLLSDGTLLEFEEIEIKEETKIIGNIAQRFSIYKKNGTLNGVDFTQVGNKLFQLSKTKQGWRINSIIWEDE